MAKVTILADPPRFQPFQYTRGARDLVPVSPSTDVLPDTVGFWPRGVRANADGTLVFRCTESEADRTIAMTAGETFIGEIVQVLAGTDCDPALIR